MSKYEGLFTFDVDNHRYIPVGQADGIIDCFKFKHESKEPLIKDEKVRKAVRAWGYSPLKFHRHSRKGYATFQICSKYICFNELFEGLKDGNSYTIDELCGEEEE